MLVINKWDAVRDKQTGTLNEYKDDVLAQLRPVSWANIVFTSAKTGQRVPKVGQRCRAHPAPTHTCCETLCSPATTCVYRNQ